RGHRLAAGLEHDRLDLPRIDAEALGDLRDGDVVLVADAAADREAERARRLLQLGDEVLWRLDRRLRPHREADIALRQHGERGQLAEVRRALAEDRRRQEGRAADADDIAVRRSAFDDVHADAAAA